MSPHKRARRKATNAAVAAHWQMWLDQLAERLRYGKTRSEREVKADLTATVKALLAAHGKLSMDQLVREQVANTKMPVKQVLAEVELYHGNVMQSLRDGGVLLYPVTQAGYEGTYGADIAKAIPGRGRGQSTFGWIVATGPDPLYNSYWAMRAGPIRGGLQKLVVQSEVAALAGVVPVAIPRSVIKRLPDGIV